VKEKKFLFLEILKDMLKYLADLKFRLLVVVVVLACVCIIRPCQCDHHNNLNQLKRELYADLLDEIRESLNSRDVPPSSVDEQETRAVEDEAEEETEYKVK
jgi:hypothetical protein